MDENDWQWVLQAAQQRWQRYDPKSGEPAPTKAYTAEKARIFRELYALAHPRSTP